MTYLQLFLRFLKINNIYYEYFNEIKNRWNENYIEWYFKKECIKNEKPFELINHAFTWNHTKKGFNFWSDVNSTWRIIINNDYGITHGLKEIPKTEMNEIINNIKYYKV